jgi:menaquinone-dependent protoporphyrinogen oxidase
MKTLVAYGSRHGSTADIAYRIGERIRKRAGTVDVFAVGDGVNVDDYDAFVIGSGVYDGSWAPEAADFLRAHASALAGKPVWLFSVASFGDRHPVVGRLMTKEPREIDELKAAVQPRGYRVFAGVVELEHWPSWARLLYRALGAHAGDNRRWPDIEAWANDIGTTLAS